MVEKKLAESHASLERKFEQLAKQLLNQGFGPGQISCVLRYVQWMLIKFPAL